MEKRRLDEYIYAVERDVTLEQIKEANELFIGFNKLQNECLRIQAIEMARDLVLHYIVSRHPAI